MTIIDKWEAELKLAPDWDSIIHGYGLTPREGLVLINLIRKKDEALKLAALEAKGSLRGFLFEEALSLTEEIGEDEALIQMAKEAEKESDKPFEDVFMGSDD